MKNYLVTIFTTNRPPHTVSMAEYDENEVYDYIHIAVRDPKGKNIVLEMTIEKNTIEIVDTKNKLSVLNYQLPQ